MYSFEEIEAWIKSNRDRWEDEKMGWDFHSPYFTYDYLLDDLRLHHATGTPLTEEAHDGNH